MRTPENRLLPMSCIAAMLVVTTTIVGLAYWVGDAMGPGFAAVAGASVRDAAAARPQLPVLTSIVTPSAPASRAQGVIAAPAPAKHASASGGR